MYWVKWRISTIESEMLALKSFPSQFLDSNGNSMSWFCRSHCPRIDVSYISFPMIFFSLNSRVAASRILWQKQFSLPAWFMYIRWFSACTKTHQVKLGKETNSVTIINLYLSVTLNVSTVSIDNRIFHV